MYTPFEMYAWLDLTHICVKSFGKQKCGQVGTQVVTVR